MAKIRTIAPVGQIRGSVGGSTYSQNRYGQYIRTRSIPTVVRNEKTELIRNSFTAASQAWGNIPSAAKTLWKEYCNLNPVYDNFGESQILTGHAMFVKLNTMIYAIKGSVNILPPGKALPGPVPKNSLVILNDETAEESKVYTLFNEAVEITDPNIVFDVRYALVDRPGRRIQENMWKVLGFCTLDATKTKLEYNDLFIENGLESIPRMVIWIKLRLFDTDTGLGGAWDTKEAKRYVEYPLEVPSP